MKMDSWGKSIKSGLIYGIVISVTCIIFTVFVYFLTNGESFLRENETIKAIGKIQSNMVINIGLVLSAIITIFFIRYKRIIYLSVCITVAILSYFDTYLIFNFLLHRVLGAENPLNSYDSLGFTLCTFPTGAAYGIIAAVIINTIVNIKSKVTEKSSDNTHSNDTQQ